eukprot:Nitzschia sp. Nitz4//scaffold18_size181773//53179//53919//NITZ4_001908-RA/size181773-processed-gene-0.227-mRNA-1//-1//CDS//3329539990//4535//frame0
MKCIEDCSTSSRKQVSFSEAQTIYFSQNVEQVADENDSTTAPATPLDQKRAFWYSSEDLVASREEAKLALQALQAANGRVECVSPEHCTRGLEKFVDAMAKVQGQRVLKESVLRQQLMTHPKKPCPEELAAVSRYLSQPCKEQAYHFAILNAIEVLDVDCDDDESDDESIGDMTPHLLSPMDAPVLCPPLTLRVPSVYPPTTTVTNLPCSDSTIDISTSVKKRSSPSLEQSPPAMRSVKPRLMVSE